MIATFSWIYYISHPIKYHVKLIEINRNSHLLSSFLLAGWLRLISESNFGLSIWSILLWPHFSMFDITSRNTNTNWAFSFCWNYYYFFWFSSIDDFTCPDDVPVEIIITNLLNFVNWLHNFTHYIILNTLDQWAHTGFFFITHNNALILYTTN